MPLGTEVGLGPCDIVLDGDPAPPAQKKVRAATFRPMSIVAKWLYVSGYYLLLGMEVGLSLGDIVLDGDPARPPLKGHSPQFSANVHCGQMAGWTKMPLGMEVGLGPGNFVFDGYPAPPT